jgi:hypothetical protein
MQMKAENITGVHIDVLPWVGWTMLDIVGLVGMCFFKNMIFICLLLSSAT